MTAQRKDEIYQLLEACQATDNSELESEKTAVIGELLAELEQADRTFERDLIAAIDWGFSPEA
jgi:hypothetical protein